MRINRLDNSSNQCAVMRGSSVFPTNSLKYTKKAIDCGIITFRSFSM